MWLGFQRIKGIRAATTPMWALNAGASILLERSDWIAGLRTISQAVVAVDLPPRVVLSPSDVAGQGAWLQERHTRQLSIPHSDLDTSSEESWPTHRRKQFRRALNLGLRIEPCNDVQRILKFHQVARSQKGLPSDELGLRTLLTSILASPHHSSYMVLSNDGFDIGSAVFLHEANRTIYAFGGQQRSKHSGLASVLLIQAGMESARSHGIECFDFGGSMDTGVDRFYAEFGAEKVVKQRYIRIAPWARPWLRLMRPDLFIRQYLAD